MSDKFCKDCKWFRIELVEDIVRFGFLKSRQTIKFRNKHVCVRPVYHLVTGEVSSPNGWDCESERVLGQCEETGNFFESKDNAK